MNLPNKLTLLRVVLIPFFIWFMSFPVVDRKTDLIIALIIFVVASLTDFVDGYLARKLKLVTNFGKFMDPLADKLLVISAMICLMEQNRFPMLALQIIIAREFIISGFRLVAADNGRVIAAGWLGKIKTALTMITIIVLIPNLQLPYVGLVENILIYLTVILTVLSLLEYLYVNKDVILDGNI